MPSSEPSPRFFAEAMGLSPPRERFDQAMIALRGAVDVPPTRFGLSSLSQLRPTIALALWRGRFHLDRHALITNLFNHRQTPILDGWSVRKTQVEDFRGPTVSRARPSSTSSEPGLDAGPAPRQPTAACGSLRARLTARIASALPSVVPGIAATGPKPFLV